MTRRAARIDANHGDVVRALRAVGCTVQSLASVGKGTPDLLVGVPARNSLPRRCLILEVKNGALCPSARELTPDQCKWHSEWAGQVDVVNSVDGALILVGAI